MLHRDIKQTNAVGKIGAHRLAPYKVATNLHFVKRKKKMQYLGNTIKCTPVMSSIRDYFLRKLMTHRERTGKNLAGRGCIFKESPYRLPGGTSGEDPVCQCRRSKRCGFDPWVRKNPLDRGAWQASVRGREELDTTKAT